MYCISWKPKIKLLFFSKIKSHAVFALRLFHCLCYATELFLLIP